MIDENAFDRVVNEVADVISAQLEMDTVLKYVLLDYRYDTEAIHHMNDDEREEFEHYLCIALCDDPDGFVELSRKDGKYYDTLIYGIGVLRSRGKDLGDRLSVFLTDHLIGKIKRPKIRGASKSAGMNKFNLTVLVQTALDANGAIRPTRDYANNSKKYSACDAVSAAYLKCGVKTVSFETVRLAWKQRGRLGIAKLPEKNDAIWR